MKRIKPIEFHTERLDLRIPKKKIIIKDQILE